VNRLPFLRASLALALVFAGLLIRAFAAEAPPTAALRTGVLPNGLHYAILPHPSAKGDISLRLIVHAGSLDERDDERGFAHFVEHMAFDGTLRHPPGSVRDFFQRLGLTFGADINASTSYTHTVYLLDLPAGRADQLDEALDVIHDYADGLLFPPEQQAKESGVVVSELRARDSAGRRNTLQMLQVVYAGTRVPDREVGGVTEQLERATPDQLRAFYRRNYQPARMTVLVVGPVDPDAVAAKIALAFGAIAAPAELVAPAATAEPPALASMKPEVVVVPTAKSAMVEFTAVGPRPPDTLEGHRRELVQRIATAVLNTRLGARREREDITRYGVARAGYDPSPVGPLVHHSIAVSTVADGMSDAVQLAETELRRARTDGFSQPEVDETVAGQLTGFRNRIATATGQPAATIANELVRVISANRAWQTPEADLAEATQALHGLTAAEVTAALSEIFPVDSLHLVLTVPPENATKPDRLLAAYTKSAGRPLKKNSAADEELRFRYEELGPPGQIAKREHLDDLDLTLVSFANGVRLNVRPSNLEPGRFRLRVVFPQNYSDVPDDRGGIAEFAGQILLNSNLGKQKETELSRLVRLRGISPQFSVSNGTSILAIGGPAAELPFALHLLTALLSDLDLDLEHERAALSRYAGLHHSLHLSLGPFALSEAIYLYTGKDSRVLLNPPEVVGRFPIDDTESWLRTHILRGPLEVGIVGDLPADDAVAAAAASVGTLKRRAAAPKPGAPLTAVTKASRHDATADLPASAALSCVFWPVTLPDDPKHNAALALATDVLRDRLLKVMRELIGATYSPDARIHRDAIQRDFAFAAMINTFDPPRAQQLTEASIRLAAQIAQRGVSAEEFDRLREPARTRYAEDLRNNGWWLNAVVSVAQSRPDVLAEARQHEKIFDEITRDDVSEAGKVFQPGTVTVLLLHAPAPKPSGKDAPAERKK
jgi:zinc protease